MTKKKVKIEKHYIDYLDCKKKFKQVRREFDNYEDAVKWGRENLSNFNIDMVKQLKPFYNSPV